MNITPIIFLQASTGKKHYPWQVLYRGCFGSCTSNYTYGENLLDIRMANLCSYWAINSPCMHLVLLKIHNVHVSCLETYSVVSYTCYRKISVDKCDWCIWGLTSSQPCTPHVVFNCMNISTVTASPFTCCISKIASF